MKIIIAILTLSFFIACSSQNNNQFENDLSKHRLENKRINDSIVVSNLDKSRVINYLDSISGFREFKLNTNISSYSNVKATLWLKDETQYEYFGDEYKYYRGLKIKNIAIFVSNNDNLIRTIIVRVQDKNFDLYPLLKNDLGIPNYDFSRSAIPEGSEEYYRSAWWKGLSVTLNMCEGKAHDGSQRESYFCLSYKDVIKEWIEQRIDDKKKDKGLE